MNGSSTIVQSESAPGELAAPMLFGLSQSSGLDFPPLRRRHESGPETPSAQTDELGESEENWEQIVRAYEWRLRAAGGPVLVLGAGNGGLMNALQRRGLEVLGCEPSPRLVCQGRRKYGFDESTLRCGEIEPFLAWLDRIGRKVQAVFLWRILEHIWNPYTLLQKLTRVLDRDRLVIAHVALLAADNAGGVGQGMADENAILQAAERCGLHSEGVDFEDCFTAFVFKRTSVGQGVSARPLASTCPTAASCV